MPRHPRSGCKAADHPGYSGAHAHPGTAQTRIRIAQAAARLIAEGLIDHHAAKLKAARQLGISDSRALPDNREIEEALVQHLALFEGDSQPKALEQLREITLRLMRRLEAFSPAVTGAVLSGTANEFSEIELDIIGVEPKDFEMYLLNAGVEFSLAVPVHKDKLTSPPAIYSCEFGYAPVSIALYKSMPARQALHPRGSLRHERAGYAEVEKRFAPAG